MLGDVLKAKGEALQEVVNFRVGEGNHMATHAPLLKVTVTGWFHHVDKAVGAVDSKKVLLCHIEGKEITGEEEERGWG